MKLKAFHLKGDPFPLVPAHDVRNWAGRPDVRELLEDIVRGVRANDIGISEFGVLHGEYGSGKSHALRFLRTLINDVETEEFRALAIYLPTIKVTARISFLALYKQIITEIGEVRIKRLAEHVANTIEQLVETEAASIGAKFLDRNAVQREVLDSRPPEDQPIIRLMLEVNNEKKAAVDYIFARGKYTTAGFDEKIDSDWAAAKMLSSILRVGTSDIGGTEPYWSSSFLFLDEVENVIEAKPAETEVFFGAIRELINELPYRFCLFLSFTADTALIEAILPIYLLRRMSRDYIEMPPMDELEAKSFLQSQLSSFWEEGFEAPTEYYPFDEEAVDKIIQSVSDLTPRTLFRQCRTLFERAIRKELVGTGDVITGEVADEILF